MKEFIYKIEYNNNKAYLNFSGRINEDTPLKDIFEELEDGIKDIVIDLSGVVSMNSYGVRMWINSFSEFENKYDYVFEKIPVVLVNQINMIYNFLPKNSIIKSFYAPFYCNNCDEESDVLLHFDSLIQSEKSVDYGIYYCNECGNELEFDEIEDEYFSFFERYRNLYMADDKSKSNIVLSNLLISLENNEKFEEKLEKYLIDEGYNILSHKNDEDSSELINIVDDKTDLLICGYENFDLTFDAIKRLKQKYENLKVVVLANENLITLLLKDWIDVFYPDNIITFVLDNEEYKLHDIGVVVKKLLSNNIFGIDKYVDKGKYQINELIIKDASEKNEYIDKLLDYASNIGIKYRLMSNIESIADEMIMNAIYNAPVDENGNDKYASIDRKTKVMLNESEYAKLNYTYDGERFILSVTDHFGRLTKEKILSYLKKCFMEPENQVEDKDGGAGLGLYLIYKQVHQFIINIDKNKKTEVIAVFFPHKRKKDIINKLFHVFIADNK